MTPNNPLQRSAWVVMQKCVVPFGVRLGGLVTVIVLVLQVHTHH